MQLAVWPDFVGRFARAHALTEFLCHVVIPQRSLGRREGCARRGDAGECEAQQENRDSLHRADAVKALICGQLSSIAALWTKATPKRS